MAIADSAQTRVAIVAEATQGTTPATPAFKTVREITTDLRIMKPRAPADDERRSDRMLAATYKKIGGVSGRISTKLAEDDALDILFTSLMCNAWSTDALKNASVKTPFSLEKLYEQGATDTFHRGAGNLIGAMSFSGQLDEEIKLGFDFMGMTGSVATAIIAGATYAAASTKKCHTVLDAVVTDIFGLTTPKLVAMDFNVTNNLRPQGVWGSADPAGIGLGRFRCEGSVKLYFEAKAQLDAALVNTEGDINVTFGETTLEKYQFIFPNAEILDHDVEDGGNDSDVFLTLRWAAKYDSGSTSQFQINRNVA